MCEQQAKAMSIPVHTVGLLGRDLPSAEVALARLKSFDTTSVVVYVGLGSESVGERMAWWQSACGNGNVYHQANLGEFVKRVEHLRLAPSEDPHRMMGFVLDHLSARDWTHPTIRSLVFNPRHLCARVISVQPHYIDWRPEVRANVDEWVVDTSTAPRNLERFCRDHDCPLPPRDLGWGVWQCHLPVATSWLPFQEQTFIATPTRVSNPTPPTAGP